MSEPLPVSSEPPKAAADGPSIRSVAAERGWQWLVSGWRLFLKSPGVWLGITIVLLIAMMLIGTVPIFGSLAIAFLMPVVAAGMMLGCQSLEQGGELRFDHLFAGFRRQTGNLVIVGIWSLVGHAVIGVVVVGIGGGAVLSGIMSGAMLGAGPGTLLALGGIMVALLVGAVLLVPLAMALWFAPALVIFSDLTPGAALKASFDGCMKNMAPFLIYGIVLFILLLLALIPIMLGVLLLIPVLTGSVFASYGDIYGQVPPPAASEAASAASV